MARSQQWPYASRKPSPKLAKSCAIGGGGQVQRTLDAGKEKGSKAKMFMRRSCKWLPCRDLDYSLNSSALTPGNSMLRSLEGPVESFSGSELSSSVDQKRTAGVVGVLSAGASGTW